MLASGDSDQCMALCQEYSVNERARAMRDRLRGPVFRNQFFRSGGTNYLNRYNWNFDHLFEACVRSFCNGMTRKLPQTSYRLSVSFPWRLLFLEAKESDGLPISSTAYVGGGGGL